MMTHKIRYQGKAVQLYLHSEMPEYLNPFLESIVERTLEFALSVKDHCTLSQYLKNSLLFLTHKKPEVIEVHFVEREKLDSEAVPKVIREKILDLDAAPVCEQSDGRLFDASTTQMPWQK